MKKKVTESQESDRSPRPKRTFIRIIIFLCLVTAAIFISRTFFPSEKEQILRVIHQLEELGSFTKQAHPFEALAKAKEVIALVGPELKIIIEESSETPREYLVTPQKVTDGYVALRRELQELSVSASKVAVDITGNRAEVNCSVRALGRDIGRSDYFLEQREVRLTFEKVDNEWRVVSASAAPNGDTI